jgi:hypothetical protein
MKSFTAVSGQLHVISRVTITCITRPAAASKQVSSASPQNELAFCALGGDSELWGAPSMAINIKEQYTSIKRYCDQH